MKHTLWNGLMAALAIVGVAWIWANRVAPGASATAGLPPAPAAGHPAPTLALATLDGNGFDLGQLRGQPVVLNFWATWCPPCRAELPELQAASRRYAGQVHIVGVDQMEPPELVRSFAGQLGLTYALPLDTDGKASRLYSVRSLPTTFFIDRDGMVRQIQVGPLTEATLADMLRSVYP